MVCLLACVSVAFGSEEGHPLRGVVGHHRSRRLLAAVPDSFALGKNGSSTPTKPTNPSHNVRPSCRDQSTADSADKDKGAKPASTTGTIIAISCVTFASTVANLGMNLQKLALRRAAALDEVEVEEGAFKNSRTVETRKNRAIWVCGLLCIIMGSVGDFGALAFGAQSLIAPLSSLALVANIVIATGMHGEEFSKRDGGCTLVIISGCVVSVIFAQQDDVQYSTECLFTLFAEPGALCYFIFIICAITGGVLFVKWIERVLESYGAQSSLYQKWYKYHRFSYACIAGTAGAQSVLLAKCLIEAISEWVNGKNKIFLAYWQIYPVILFLCLSVAMQIYWLNMGLARFDALYNVPVFQCFWMLFSTIGGGVFFQEFWSFSLIQALMFPLGVSLCVFGVYLLSQRPQSGGAYAGKGLEDGQDQGKNIKSPLLSSPGEGSSSSNYGGEDAFAEIEVTVQGKSIGVGLYPDVVKITHPKYSRVQCMVKVWRVRDFPLTEVDDEESETNSNAVSAESQGLRIGMILVGIDGVSLLQQKNMWNSAIEKLKKTKRPMTLTFRDINSGGIESPSKAGTRYGQGARAHSFADVVSTSGAGELRMAGRANLKRTRSQSQYVPVTEDDVMMANKALDHRPMVGSTLNILHAGKFIGTSRYDNLVSGGGTEATTEGGGMMAEFAHHISGSVPPILDRVLDSIAPVGDSRSERTQNAT